MTELGIEYDDLAAVRAKILGNPVKVSGHNSLRGIGKEAKMLQQLTADNNEAKSN